MDEGTLRMRLWEGFAELQLLLGAHAGPGRTLERDGLVASIVPTAPDSPTLNAAVALDPDKAPDHLDELARRYAKARVRRWGMWLDGGASLAAQALTQAGFTVTAASPGMGASSTSSTPTATARSTRTSPRSAESTTSRTATSTAGSSAP